MIEIIPQSPVEPKCEEGVPAPAVVSPLESPARPLRWLNRERDRPKKHLSIRGWNDLVDMLSLVGEVPFEAGAYLDKMHEFVPCSSGRVKSLADATQNDWIHLLWEAERRRPDLVERLRERRAEAASAPNS